MRWLIKREKPKTTDLKESRVLPSHQHYPLRALWPAIHLECFDQIILPALEQCHALLSPILIIPASSSYPAVTAFDQKYHKILESLNYLKISTIKLGYYSQDTQLAIWIFVFYRVLYHHTTLTSLENNNDHRLLKRMSPTLIWYLNADYWRLFELALIIESDLSTLILNQDIKEWIETGSNIAIEDTATRANQIQSVNHENSETIADKLNDSTDATEDGEAHNNTHHLASTTISKQDGETILTAFIEWLTHKIKSQDKRFRINRGDYCFAKLLHHGHQTLFVTESLLLLYQNITHVSSTLLVALITEKNLTDSKTFYLKKDQHDILLFRINDIPILQAPDQSVTIQEVTHENVENVKD